MDPETQRLWNEWADRRIEAALRAEREHFEHRLRSAQLEICEAVKEGFEISSNAMMDFVNRAVAEGLERSVAQASALLSEFNKQVNDAIERRPLESGPRETIN